MNMCPISDDFRDRAIWMYNHKTVDKKETVRVRTISNTGSYCSSDRVGTVYNKFSKISTVNINALCNWCEDMACNLLILRVFDLRVSSGAMSISHLIYLKNVFRT